MVLNISLDHLQDDEVELILKVLERDARIQKQEDARRQRLQNSVRGERIPEKRLSVKIRTGEWMTEMTAPSRIPKRRGTEIVRASIRRKGRKEEKKEKSIDIQNKEKLADASPAEVKKPEVLEDDIKKDAKAEPDKVLEDANAISRDHESPKSELADETQNKSPFRKTSIRRKKTSPSADKQVKFDTEKTKKFVYEQTRVESNESTTVAPEEPQSIPQIVIQEEVVAKAGETKEYKNNVEVTVINEPAARDAKAKDSDGSFESYHNSYGQEIYGKQVEGEAISASKNEKEKVDDAPKGMKKIKVIKRKGSSRRKGGKITDDSSRNSLFNVPVEEKPSDEEKAKIATEIAESVVTAVNENKEEILNSSDASNSVSEILSATETYQDNHKELDSNATDATYSNYPESGMKEEKEGEDYAFSVSSLMGEVARQYEKLIEEESRKVEDHDAAISANEPTTGVDSSDTGQGQTYGKEVEESKGTNDHEYSPRRDLDLGLSDVLNTISEKYDSVVAESHDPKILPEVDTSPQKGTSALGIYTAAETTEPHSDDLNHHNLSLTSDIMKEAEETVSVTTDNTPKEAEDRHEIATYISKEEQQEEKKEEAEPKEDKPKKKVVKKIVKKKKTEKPEGEEHESPNSADPTQVNEENVEESQNGAPKLHRVKTIRKKVVRRAPPPSE